MGTLSRPVFQVFINFRGKDIRNGFASHLVDALKRHNINYFIDTREVMGKPLTNLFQRIEEASVALVILSTRYCESKWCLEELSTIMEQARKGEMVAIPIFYKVKPEDVKRQKGEFGCRFLRRTRRSSREEIAKWQLALKAVSKNFGLTLNPDRSEAKFIKKVIKKVGEVLGDIQYDERREDDCVKNVTTYSIVVTLPWALFASVVGMIGAVLLGFGLLINTAQRCASPAMVALVGSVVVKSSCWVDK